MKKNDGYNMSEMNQIKLNKNERDAAIMLALLEHAQKEIKQGDVLPMEDAFDDIRRRVDSKAKNEFESEQHKSNLDVQSGQLVSSEEARLHIQSRIDELIENHSETIISELDESKKRYDQGEFLSNVEAKVRLLDKYKNQNHDSEDSEDFSKHR